MHCELVVPGLFSAPQKSRLPALERLLARGRRRSAAAQHLEAWLHGAFGLEEQTLPAGALTLAAANADPGETSWLRADPVHLRLMRDRLVVVPAEGCGITGDEAAALCAALNQHFAGRLEIKAVDPRRWCARIEGGSRSNPASALEAAGREVTLDRDSDPLLNEIQMLLHAHPVNAAREARGEPVLNSLWLWGAGRLPRLRPHWDAVLADEPIAMGLARVSRAGYRSLPPSAGAWLERAPQDGRNLVVLDALRVPAALGELTAYQENLDALEAAWFAPLLAALRAGRVGMVTVDVPDSGAASSFEAVRGDLRRFWRRPKALESYA